MRRRKTEREKRGECDEKGEGRGEREENDFFVESSVGCGVLGGNCSFFFCWQGVLWDKKKEEGEGKRGEEGNVCLTI